MRLVILGVAAMLLAATARAQDGSAASGFASPVIDAASIGAATARFQGELRGLGLSVQIESCRLTERVAVGVRGGEIAYGAACRMRLGERPIKEFVVCDSDLSGFGTLFAGSFVDTPEWMASFIRRNCF